MRSSRRREDLILIISDVIQADNVVREFGNDQIQWRSSSELRVVEYESRRSVRVTGGFFMRGVEFRSHMNLRELILLRRRYVNVVAGRGRIRNDIYAGEYRNVVGGDHEGRTDDRV